MLIFLEKEMATHSSGFSLPGKSYGQRSLVGCGPWGCKELDTTEQLKKKKKMSFLKIYFKTTGLLG